MLHSDLATNPYALITLVCLMTAVVAPITLTVYKYAVFLMLITFDSLILCQYRCTLAPCQLEALMYLACKCAFVLWQCQVCMSVSRNIAHVPHEAVYACTIHHAVLVACWVCTQDSDLDGPIRIVQIPAE